MNVQIYFHKDGCNLQDISQEKKREIFTIGMKRTINSVNELKLLILENEFFGIKEINGNSVLLQDGTRKGVNFVLHVDDSFRPANGDEIICLFSTIDRVFFNDQIVKVRSIMSLPKIPCEREGDGSLNDEIREKIRDLVALFGRGAERLGDIVSDREIRSVEFLERLIGENRGGE